MPRIDDYLKAAIKFKIDATPNLTAGKLAVRIGTSPSYFSQLINGLYIMPDEMFQIMLDELDMRKTYRRLRKLGRI